MFSFSQRRFIVAAFVLLLCSGCSYPIKVKPFFNGTLNGTFTSEARYPEQNTTVDGNIMLELEAIKVSEEQYDILGTALFQGESYKVRGVEQAGFNMLYLRPQSYLIAGGVSLEFYEEETLIYALCGQVRYGYGGGPYPIREKPMAQFLLYPTPQTQSYCDVDSPYIEENIPLGYLELKQ